MTGAAGRGLTLALGVAIGALASAILFQALADVPSSVEASEAKLPPHEATETARALALPHAPPASVNPAAQPTVALDNLSSRIRAALVETEDRGNSNELLAAFHAAFERGEIAEEDLVQLLFDVLLAHGNPEAALDLVNRFRALDSGALVQVAIAFAQQGKQVQAQELMTRALALTPDDGWVLDQYAGVDPGGALPYYLARLGQQPPPGDPSLRMEIAQLLVNSGKAEEARAQIDSLLRQNPRDVDALQLLATIDPACAESIVRNLIAAGPGDGDWNGFLFQMVLGQGRTEDALALLENRRTQGFAPESVEYGSIAQKYLEQKQTAAAVQMWAAAFDAEQGDPDSWTAALQQYAPAKLLTLLEARVAQGANDEFWGALGDSYWRAGLHTEALNAWREAARLDPADLEWPEKVAAVAAGTAPL